MPPSKQLLILGCSETKRESPGLLPAIDRYDGTQYRVLRSFLREHEWPENLSVAVLSAQYGLMGGMTRIESYDRRMTTETAEEKAESCCETLHNWATSHASLHVCLGKDYLPALQPAIGRQLKKKTKIFEGPIGEKAHQVKELLERTDAPSRRERANPKVGKGTMSYFLPDWDDLLDGDFDFKKDRFSGASPREREDQHCCVLMQPKRMCDGVLVSLAQHLVGKGPLKKYLGTDDLSLAPTNLRNQFGLDNNQFLFGDCGAFSYVNEDEPTISIDQAVALYDLHGFDFGASVDHIPTIQVAHGSTKKKLSKRKREERVEITKENAAAFIAATRRRKTGFTPVGTIQALTPSDYAATAQYYHKLGYRHIAIGGLVPLQDALIEQIVTAVMTEVSKLSPRPWVHLFGIFRPKLQAKFRELNVDSFDSATYFRKAWLRSDQNYLAADGEWYAAIRVPMTTDARTLKRLEESGREAKKLAIEEASVLRLLGQYDRGTAQINEVLDAVLSYDKRLTRTSDERSLRKAYRRTLRERPWQKCDCPFCQSLGIHIVIFRGCNRNKRRGAHNTLMLYGSLAPNA